MFWDGKVAFCAGEAVIKAPIICESGGLKSVLSTGSVFIGMASVHNVYTLYPS